MPITSITPPHYWPQAAAGLPFFFHRIPVQRRRYHRPDRKPGRWKKKPAPFYDNLLRAIKDPEVREPLKFLRAREIVHFQRFGEALEKTKETLDAKNFYYFNPEYDKAMYDAVKS